MEKFSLTAASFQYKICLSAVICCYHFLAVPLWSNFGDTHFVEIVRLFSPLPQLHKATPCFEKTFILLQQEINGLKPEGEMAACS